MSQEKFEGRNVIWESKTKSVLVITISFSFTIMAIYGKDNMSGFSFWGTVLFFGLGGIFMLVRLLSPKNIFVTYDSEIGKKILNERQEMYEKELGSFHYDENGFSIHIDGLDAYYNWNEIETVFGYKTDLVAYDEICLDVYTSDNEKFTISEETWGWFQFISKLSENIPSISIGWSIEIIQPAFERNLTLLYDKKNRTEKELERLYYVKTDY